MMVTPDEVLRRLFCVVCGYSYYLSLNELIRELLLHLATVKSNKNQAKAGRIA